MASHSIIRFADGFAEVSQASWAAEVVLSGKGRTVDDLAGRSADGIVLGPLYAPARDRAILAGARSGARWTIVQRIDEPDVEAANRAIIEAGDTGADLLELVFEGSALARGRGIPAARTALSALFADVGSLTPGLRVDAGRESAALARAIATQIKAVPEPGWAVDPIALLAAGNAGNADDTQGAGLADGRFWHDSGATEAQELGIVLASFTAQLRTLVAQGAALDDAASRVGFAVAVDADQFLSVAKLRALRLLHARILEAAGIAGRAAAIHAETSWRMLSRLDRHVNILRTTSAAFAAGAGGADSIAALPFDVVFAGTGDPHARRIARNTQLVLGEEAGIGQVADPGAGSGAIEALTDALAEAAWRQFQAIEAEGGIVAAIRSGKLAHAIAAARDARLERARRLLVPLTGTSAFANPREPALASPALLGNGARSGLQPTRTAEPFEELRDRAARAGGPEIALVCVGRRADYAETANEAANFFAIGGVRTREIGADDLAGLAAASGLDAARMACICHGPKGGDGVPAAALAAREAGASQIVYFGAPGTSEDRLRAAGVARFIVPGGDAVALLGDVLDLIAGRGGKP